MTLLGLLEGLRLCSTVILLGRDGKIRQESVRNAISSCLLSNGRFNFNFAPLNKHCLKVFTDVLQGYSNLRNRSSLFTKESERRAETRVLQGQTSPSSVIPTILKFKYFSNKIYLLQLRISRRKCSENYLIFHHCQLKILCFHFGLPSQEVGNATASFCWVWPLIFGAMTSALGQVIKLFTSPVPTGEATFFIEYSIFNIQQK